MSLISKKDILLFYFSGHGSEYNGENCLYLADSNPSSPSDIPYETYQLGKLLGRIQLKQIRTSVIILDACRSNPFTKSWNRDGYLNQGLANIQTPSGTFIGYAASPGMTASDGEGRNGTYTAAILKYINNRNYTIDQLFTKVNKEVRIKSKGKQVPFKNSSLEDDFYIVGQTNITPDYQRNIFDNFEAALNSTLYFQDELNLYQRNIVNTQKKLLSASLFETEIDLNRTKKTNTTNGVSVPKYNPRSIDLKINGIFYPISLYENEYILSFPYDVILSITENGRKAYIKVSKGTRAVLGLEKDVNGRPCYMPKYLYNSLREIRQEKVLTENY